MRPISVDMVSFPRYVHRKVDHLWCGPVGDSWQPCPFVSPEIGLNVCSGFENDLAWNSQEPFGRVLWPSGVC